MSYLMLGLLSVVLFVHGREEVIARYSEQAGSHAEPDETLYEALSEGCCALVFFSVVLLGGRAVGWKVGGQPEKKIGKGASGRGKVAIAGHATAEKNRSRSPDQEGQEWQVSRSRASVEQPLRNGSSDEDSSGANQPRFSPARRTHPSLAAEADILASAVRIGNAVQLPQLLDAGMARLAKEDPAAIGSSDAVLERLLVASLRACASKRCFREAIVLYRHVANRLGNVGGSIWSLLLWSAEEAGQFQLCGRFLDRLCQDGVPTSHDFVNIVRYYVYLHDPAALAERLAQLQAGGCHIDVIARNRALGLCTSHRAVDLAQVIVECATSVPMDTIAYNTMMKGFAAVGSLVKCFETYSRMRRAGVTPNEMTFGILLDACIDDGQLEHARQVFADLRQSGLELNVVLFTTFIKGLVNAGELTEAMGILDEMCESQSAQPDLVTFSTLAKALASTGCVMDCLRLLERMTKLGIQADAVLFNTVLTSCASKPVDPEQVNHVFTWLVKRGLKPSTATISVLIKAFSLSGSWTHALEILEAAPDRYNVWPEPRVYGQLAQSCAREGCKAEVLAAYSAMVKAAGKQGTVVKRSNSVRLHRLCALCGLGTSAAKIFDALTISEGRVDASVLAVLEAAA